MILRRLKQIQGQTIYSKRAKKDKHVDGVSLEAFELFGRFGVPPFPSSLSIY